MIWGAAMTAPAPARDLVVYGEPTLEQALQGVGLLWQARAGNRVNIFSAPTALSLAQIERGARCDLIFGLAGPVMDNAGRRQVVGAETIIRVLRNPLVLVGTSAAPAVGAGATLSDIFRLIAGRKLAIADPARDPAGAGALEFLGRIGIAVEVESHRIAVAESTAGVVSMLAAGKAVLGIVYATDAAAGFHLAIPLPEQASVEYVVANARDRAVDTRPFREFLKSAAAHNTFKSAGLVPIEDGAAGVAIGGQP